MGQIAFVPPKSVTVPSDTVSRPNGDGGPHSTAVHDGSTVVKSLLPAATGVQVFHRPGSNDFFSFHSFVTGRITVRAS